MRRPGAATEAPRRLVRFQSNVVEHAQLVLGDGMVMLASVDRTGDRAIDRLVTTVRQTGAPTSTRT